MNRKKKKTSVFEAIERWEGHMYMAIGGFRFVFWLQTMQLLSELNKKTTRTKQ